MSEREVALLLEDILEASQKILSYTSGMTFDDFRKDDKTIDAVVRNFEIVGEAANRIPEKVKTDYKNIEWRRLIGFRNRIIHEYFGIDYAMVWKIKEENIPELIVFIKKLINDYSLH